MVASNLALHCGARAVSYEDLEGMSMPRATRSFVPIAHKTLVDRALAGLKRHGFEVAKARYGVGDGSKRRGTQGGGMTEARFFGTLDLRHPLGGDDVCLAMGLRNSVDKSLTAGICAGERVFVCDNLCMAAEVVVMRKHTRWIMRDLDEKIETAFTRLPEFAERREHQIAAMKRTTITDVTAHDFLIRALDEKVITTTELPNVLAEWRDERNAQRFGDHTVWNLHNGVTEVKKDGFARYGRHAANASRETMGLATMINRDLITGSLGSGGV